MLITLVIAVVVALVVLIPTRRLQLAGWSRDGLWTYFASVWLVGVVVALEPAPTRLLVPILLIAYLAPFLSVRAGLERLFGRPGPSARRPPEPEKPPMKNVTPPEPPGQPGE